MKKWCHRLGGGREGAERGKSPISFSSVLTLSHRCVGAAAVPEREPHDLPFGEDEEHDAALDAHGDDDHHDGPGELLVTHADPPLVALRAKIFFFGGGVGFFFFGTSNIQLLF